MNEATTAVLLVGSPKGLARSAGSRRGSVLLDALQDRGWAQEKVHFLSALRSEEGRAGLLKVVASTDLVILATPLYVDSLPAPVVEALEHLHGHRRSLGEPKRFVTLPQLWVPRGIAQRDGPSDLPPVRRGHGMDLGGRSLDGRNGNDGRNPATGDDPGRRGPRPGRSGARRSGVPGREAEGEDLALHPRGQRHVAPARAEAEGPAEPLRPAVRPLNRRTHLISSGLPIPKPLPVQ